MWMSRAVLCFLLFSAVSPAWAAPLVVVVDPGHGGDKDGAVGPRGEKEKELALAISTKLVAILEARGYEVVSTRTEDVSLDLASRVRLANERGADFFVSVHANSVASQQDRVHGVETYFLSAEASDAQAAALAEAENADDPEAGKLAPSDPLARILADLARARAHQGSSELAVELHRKLVEATGAKDRGVRQAPFFVLSGARMPAVLVEVGYISHPAESLRLTDEAEQERMARAMADGIDAYGRRVLATASPTR